MTNLDYLYNPEAAKPYFNKDYFLDKKLGFQVIENGMILPHKSVNIPGKWHAGIGGIIDSQGKFIRHSGFHSESLEIYSPPSESIQHSSETVIYLGMFFPVWGHDLTDNIRHVWFLKSDDFRNEFKKCPIVYIPCKDGTITVEQRLSFKRLLEILEVDLDKVQPIIQPTQFNKIIFPDESFLSPYYKIKGFTAEYLETVERVRNFALKNRIPASNKKIYYFNGRKGFCEERLAEYFKSKGYDIVRPEMLPLDEQLNLLINAEHFASIGCSCAHNSLFLRDRTEQVFIPRAHSQFGYYQEIINQVNSLNINYVDSSLSIFSEGIAQGNHFYIISKQLKRFFGDNWNGYEEDDYKNFLKYVKDSISKGCAINPQSKKYYAPILEDFMAQLKQREDLIVACNMPPRWETFTPSISYQTHIHTKGWVAWQNEEQISGSTEDNLDIQAVKINLQNYKVYYSVYYNDEEGWSEEVTNGEMAGTTGKRKAIYGIRIRLDEAGAKEFDILYRVHKFDGEWTKWAKNGEALYSYGVKLNAIQIKLEPANTQPDKDTPKQPVKDTPKQPVKDTPKQTDKDAPKQPDKDTLEQTSDIQTFLMRNNKEIYLQVLRQDLTKID